MKHLGKNKDVGKEYQRERNLIHGTYVRYCLKGFCEGNVSVDKAAALLQPYKDRASNPLLVSHGKGGRLMEKDGIQRRQGKGGLFEKCPQETFHSHRVP